MGFPQSADGFVQTALTQSGDKYVYGAEASASNPNPSAFDCSELVEWALARIGLRFVDGAENQYRTCKGAGKEISVAQAVSTRGALLFRIGNGPRNGQSGNHVGISQGNGQTIEARGRAYGVGQWSATSGRTWTHGGLVPGLPGYGLGSGGSAAEQIDPEPTPLTPEQIAEIKRKLDLDTLAAITRSMQKVVRYGDKGEAITILQRGLQRQGYWVPVTNVFDGYTRSVVQQHQAKRGKRADGIVGPVTWNTIFPEFNRFAY
jgi:cell wall-associated NlpC family hydrolase